MHWHNTDMFRAWVLDESQVSTYGDIFPVILREVGRQKAEEMFLVSWDYQSYYP